MRALSLILVIAVSFSVNAFDNWYDSAVAVPPGLHIVGDSEDNTIVSSVFQLRGSSKADAAEWGIIWDMTDSTSFTRARLTTPASSRFDDDFGSHFGLIVERVDSGLATVLYEAEPGSQKGVGRGFNTLKLISDDPVGRTARLYAGQKELRHVAAVPLNGGKFAVWVGKGKDLMLRRQMLEIDTVALPAMTALDMDTALSEESDSVQGEWEFLDRDVRNNQVSLGGRYRIVTIADSSGGYEIIYIGGADINPRIWQPGCVKGYLRPTNFQGDFDLVWFDSLGRRLQGEQSATLTGNGELLQLNFPLIGAQVRFRKVLRQNR